MYENFQPDMDNTQFLTGQGDGYEHGNTNQRKIVKSFKWRHKAWKARKNCCGQEGGPQYVSSKLRSVHSLKLGFIWCLGGFGIQGDVVDLLAIEITIMQSDPLKG